MAGNRASPKMTTVRDLQTVLLTSIPNSQVPKVTNGTFQDAKNLFGDDLKGEVKLRLPGRHAGSVQLQQFDPNFWSNEVICRHPSCHKSNPDANRGIIGIKRDLYLCQTHLDELKSKIARKIEVISEPFSLSMEDHDPAEDLAKYTASLIGLLEVVFHDSKKKSPVILEAILNVRNFLIITSTVLNPDAATAVPLVALILRLMLQNKNPDDPDDLLSVLREVIGLILPAYGINYTWIWKTTAPFGRTFVGGCIGAAAAAVAFTDRVPSRVRWLAILLFGILCGIYLFIYRKDQVRRQEIISKLKVVYDFHGGDDGAFDLSVCRYNGE